MIVAMGDDAAVRQGVKATLLGVGRWPVGLVGGCGLVWAGGEDVAVRLVYLAMFALFLHPLRWRGRYLGWLCGLLVVQEGDAVGSVLRGVLTGWSMYSMWYEGYIQPFVQLAAHAHTVRLRSQNLITPTPLVTGQHYGRKYTTTLNNKTVALLY